MIVSYLIRRASDGLYMTPKGTRGTWAELAGAHGCSTPGEARSWVTLWGVFGNKADRLEVWRMTAPHVHARGCPLFHGGGDGSCWCESIAAKEAKRITREALLAALHRLEDLESDPSDAQKKVRAALETA